MERVINIAVFCSGRGTNLQAIISAIKNKKLRGVNIALVISDNYEAYALTRARKAGIKYIVVDPKKFDTFDGAKPRPKRRSLKAPLSINPEQTSGFSPRCVEWVTSKSEFEKDIIRHLKKERVDLIVLAGFMRIIGPDFLKAYKDRIFNIHPALLPSFKGAHAIKDAFEYGVKVTGVTIHFVDEKTDHGPIIMQEAVPIKENDTLETLEARIHKVEHKLYYKAIQLFVDGKLKIEGRKVK